jgi:hypothetical protein
MAVGAVSGESGRPAREKSAFAYPCISGYFSASKGMNQAKAVAP